MAAALSFNTWNHSSYWGLPPTLPDQITAAALVGYDYVGLDVPSLLAHEADGFPAGAVRECLDGSGLSCFEIGGLSLSDDVDLMNEELAQVLRLAPTVGAQEAVAVVFGPVTDRVVAGARRCTEELAAVGVGVSVEFLPTFELNSIDSVRRLLELVGHPELRVLVDSWHFFVGPDDWDSLDRLPEEQLRLVQFGDVGVPVSDDVADEFCHHRLLPGEGTCDLASFAERVLSRWPDVVVSVEVLSSAWRDRPVDEFAAQTLRSTRRFW